MEFWLGESMLTSGLCDIAGECACIEFGRAAQVGDINLTIIGILTGMRNCL